MSHFYGKLQGGRGEVTRCGTKNSGVKTVAASWSGAIETRVWYDPENDLDRFEVFQRPWHGAGIERTIARGIVGGSLSYVTTERD